MATSIDDAMGSSATVSPAAARQIAGELDGMQSRVSDIRVMITDANTSLRRWLRLASFLGFLGALWVLWAQISLARRGWRGSRARSI
jgi:small-conductance mechanosensitive channel